MLRLSTGYLEEHGSPTAAAGCRAPDRPCPRARADRALHELRPAAERARAGRLPGAARTARAARAGRLHPRPVGLPRPRPRRGRAGARPAARDRGAGRALPGAAGRAAGRARARRRHRLGRDRAGGQGGRARTRASRPTDVSADALAVAAANAARARPRGRARASPTCWPALAGRRFDLIASNPPYIAEAEIETLEPEVARFEPRLRDRRRPGGHRGARAAGRAPRRTRSQPGGWLVVECGAGQARGGARADGRRRRGARRAPSATWPGSSGSSAAGGRDRPRATRCAPAASRSCRPTRSTASAAPPATATRARACTRARRGRRTSRPRSSPGSVASLLERVLPELDARVAGALCRRVLPGPVTLIVPNPGRRFAHLCGATPDADRRARARARGGGRASWPTPSAASRSRAPTCAARAAPARLADVPAALRGCARSRSTAASSRGTPSSVDRRHRPRARAAPGGPDAELGAGASCDRVARSRSEEAAPWPRPNRPSSISGPPAWPTSTPTSPG